MAVVSYTALHVLYTWYMPCDKPIYEQRSWEFLLKKSFTQLRRRGKKIRWCTNRPAWTGSKSCWDVPFWTRLRKIYKSRLKRGKGRQRLNIMMRMSHSRWVYVVTEQRGGKRVTTKNLRDRLTDIFSAWESNPVFVHASGVTYHNLRY